MNAQTFEEKPAWTWADQISTYRFWGMLIFYFLSALSMGTLSSFLGMYYTSSLGLSFSQLGVFFAIMSTGGVFGLYLGWVTSRYRAKAVLVAAVILQILGGLLATIPEIATILSGQITGGFLLGLGTGAIALSIPAILVNGRGDGETFVIAFGAIYIFEQIGKFIAAAMGGFIWDVFGDYSLAIIFTTVTSLGFLFLLPIKSILFQETPPKRGYSLKPLHREPVLVAVFCLIPFYYLYWLYRAHGEVAAIASAQKILSPRASWLASLFIPLIYPIIVTSLIDSLNSRAVELNKPLFRQP